VLNAIINKVFTSVLNMKSKIDYSFSISYGLCGRSDTAHLPFFDFEIVKLAGELFHSARAFLLLSYIRDSNF
jgi:hypothetical protein